MELLAWGNKVMEPHLFRIAPQAGSGESYAHEGEEFLFVLRGELKIALASEEYHLKRGDSFYFESATPHHWKNPASSESLAVVGQHAADILSTTKNRPYASCSHPTSSAAPSLFQVLTDPALRLVSIAAISARDTFDFCANCSWVSLRCSRQMRSAGSPLNRRSVISKGMSSSEPSPDAPWRRRRPSRRRAFPHPPSAFENRHRNHGEFLALARNGFDSHR